MDIVFDEGEDVAFSVIGENTIFLTGNMIPEEPYDLPPEDDSDEEEVDSGEEVSTDEDSEMEMEEEKVERLPNKPNLSKPQQCSVATVSPPETPKNNIKKPQTAVSTAKSVDEPPRKKQAVEPKAAEMEAEPAVRTLPSGLIIEDIQKGNGPRAKNGHRVSVRYIGKLSSGKLFDQNTKGKPFSFVLGKGECIKGWDLGVQGMQVGGTRRLTIPPQLAYGKRGAPPDIPSNAILKFDIKLLDTKGK
jgi:FK506-binding nuclear protein